MIRPFTGELLLFQLRWMSSPLDDPASTDLRRALAFYVDELRDSDWRLEDVILAVKRVAWEAGIRPSRQFPSPGEPRTPNDRLLVDMVRWTTEYFVHPVPGAADRGARPRDATEANRRARSLEGLG
jgi:hypothetical protein